MEKLSFFSKLTAALSVSAGGIWAGAYLVKIFVMYQFFITGEMNLKSQFVDVQTDIGIQILAPVFITSFISYIIAVLTFILFLASSKLNLKKNGWLFITTVIVAITLPFEVFLMMTDYKIIVLLLRESFNPDVVLTLFKQRLSLLSSFSPIIILSYISIVFMIIFKPLTLKAKTT